MNLEQYMIPTPAEESDWSDLKATLLTGGVMLAPFGIAAVINAFKQAKYRKMDKKKISGIKPENKTSNVTEEINKRIMTDHPELWAKEQKERIKAMNDIDRITRSLAQQWNKSTPIGLAFLTRKEFEDMWGEDPEFLPWVEFTQVPLPARHPSSDNYGGWSGTSQWEISTLSYDIWDYVQEHPECNARNFDQCRVFWNSMNSMIEAAKKAYKSNKFYYDFYCGGDWDDGDFEVALRPSDTILKVAYELGYSKWPTPKN